ncbi:Carbonic anhydrase- protein 10 [Bulinus truncatus]|nr:Carbonic anhydrase- protein 10 [Bulinus truncatus]
MSPSPIKENHMTQWLVGLVLGRSSDDVDESYPDEWLWDILQLTGPLGCLDVTLCGATAGRYVGRATERNPVPPLYHRLVACVVVIYFVITSLAINDHGQWSSVEDYDEFEEDIDKEIPCSQPPNIANGETVVWGEGLLLEYRCKSGYSPVGITHGACDLKTGTWTIEPPVCTDQDCPPLSPPTHGIVKVDTGGGLATIICRPGYFLIGDSTLVCEEGQWKGSYPACAVTTETNEHTKSRRGQGENMVLKRSYSMPGITLDDSDETCFYNHVTPPEIQHAVVETTYVMNEAKHRYVMVATYRCMGGYKLRSHRHNTLFCKNLIWTANRAPECVSGEMHIIAYNGELYKNLSEATRSVKGLAIIAVFMEIGKEDNKYFYGISQELHRLQQRDSKAQVRGISMDYLLPKTTEYVTYEGSLTQPGCYETVTWILLNKPLRISKEQLSAMRVLYNGRDNDPGWLLETNARPLMPLNHRVVRTNINSQKRSRLCTMERDMFYQVNGRYLKS